MQNNIQTEEIDFPPLKASSNWLKCSLEDCCEILDYKRIPVSIEERKNRRGEIPYYGATGLIGWIDDYIFDEELLLLGEDGAPFFDKSKPISYIVKGKSWVNNHAHVLRALSGVTSNRFLKFYLDHFDFNGYVTGTTRLKLNQSSLRKISVFLPPLAEQHRIVAKLEKSLAKVDQAQIRLEKIPSILKHFRKAVFEAACSGKLTDEWRKQNPNVETGQNLIKKILEIKQKGSKKHKNNDVDQVENSDLPNIPDSWGWSYLQNLGELSRGKSKHRPRNDPKLFGGSYPFIQTGDVANSNGKIKNHTQTYNEIGLAQSRLFPPNTLCITIAANIADTAILAYPACFPDSIVGFIPQEGLFEVEFAMYFIKTAQNDLSMFAPATAQKNINLAILQKLPIPVPPLEEQKEIVRRARELFQLADQIEHCYQKAKTHIDHLTQSILAKAFRGELVPQDPKDEPASELLKRIKAEKARQEAENKPNRKPKPKKGRANKKAAV